MSFDFQPTLKGELLELRPLWAEDFHDLYAAASDPLIWEQHPVRDRYKEEVFKEFFREFLIGPQNVRSQRAIEKVGGVRVGSRSDGGGRESFVYQITASTFAQVGRI